MTNKLRTGLLFLDFAATLAGCDGGGAPGLIGPPPPPPPPPPAGGPAFSVADVTVSGFVFEVTSTGRVPIEGVTVANGEGWGGLTDANGAFSFRPVWVCPCAAQPWVPAGTTFLWVAKDGYEDPAGQTLSVFGGLLRPGARRSDRRRHSRRTSARQAMSGHATVSATRSERCRSSGGCGRR